MGIEFQPSVCEVCGSLAVANYPDTLVADAPKAYGRWVIWRIEGQDHPRCAEHPFEPKRIYTDEYHFAQWDKKWDRRRETNAPE